MSGYGWNATFGKQEPAVLIMFRSQFVCRRIQFNPALVHTFSESRLNRVAESIVGADSNSSAASSGNRWAEVSFCYDASHRPRFRQHGKRAFAIALSKADDMKWERDTVSFSRGDIAVCSHCGPFRKIRRLVVYGTTPRTAQALAFSEND